MLPHIWKVVLWCGCCRIGTVMSEQYPCISLARNYYLRRPAPLSISLPRRSVYKIWCKSSPPKTGPARRQIDQHRRHDQKAPQGSLLQGGAGSLVSAADHLTATLEISVSMKSTKLRMRLDI